MTGRNEDEFRPRLRAPKADKQGRGRDFVGRVLAELRYSGGPVARFGSHARATAGRNARGLVASKFAGAALNGRSRRVTVKARLVRLSTTAPRSTAGHLHYITRDGAGRDGHAARPYTGVSNEVDLEAFERRVRNDRHQFRFIVAPEDAAALEELPRYTRTLMRTMEADLGTRLQWVAVDHWDTDNPHTHIVLRGKDERGRDLVIARDYISSGMRKRAAEIATEWLGPRTEREIRVALMREVTEQRWTSLDRELTALSHDGKVELASGGLVSHPRRELLVGRLQTLERLQLAREARPGVWGLPSGFELTLRAIGERGDIVRTMQRAFTAGQREFAVFDPGRSNVVTGRLAAKGVVDELRSDSYAIIDGIDGRAHYVRVTAETDLDPVPIGAIIEVHGGTDRVADCAITELAQDGVYRTARHLTHLRANPPGGRIPQEIVMDHVRRLEALRRGGIVERLAEGVWRVPNDLPARGRAHDARRLGAARLEIRSYWPIERQVRGVAATWLDRQLVAKDVAVAEQGFGVSVRSALLARTEWLLEQGYAQRERGRAMFGSDVLAKLRARELATAGERLATESGLVYRPLSAAARVSGVLRSSLVLGSGKFAVLQAGSRFTLVPWRPIVERHLGQHVTAVARGDHVSWDFGRQLSR